LSPSPFHDIQPNWNGAKSAKNNFVNVSRQDFHSFRPPDLLFWNLMRIKLEFCVFHSLKAVSRALGDFIQAVVRSTNLATLPSRCAFDSPYSQRWKIQ
jgi:hypothetical protein